MRTKLIVITCCLLIVGMAGNSAGVEVSEQHKGATIRQQKEWALKELRTAVKSPQLSDAERKAVKSLEIAWELLEKKNRKTEDYRQAFELTQHAAESIPDEFRYLAEYLLGASQHRLAFSAAVDSALASLDSSSEPCFFDVETYRQSQHSKTALDHLTAAITISPSFLPAYERLCSHHQSIGNMADALRVADTLVKLSPQCSESLQVRALCYADLEQHEMALGDLSAAVQLSPKNVIYISRLAAKLSELGRGLEATIIIQFAITGVEADIEVSPNDPWLYFDKASLLCDLGEYDEAISAYEAAFKFAESDDMRGRAQLLIGMVAYYIARDFDRAISAFTLAKSFDYEAEWCDELIAECLDENQNSTKQIVRP